MNRPAPTLTAVIRAKDREHTIGRAIASVQMQSVPSEVIVVDSGSRDRTVEVAASMGARVIEIPAESFTYGGAINVGVAAASADHVLVLSAHCCLPHESWAEDALTHFADERVAGLNGFVPSARADGVADSDRVELALEQGASRGPLVQDEPWFGFVGFSNHASLVRRSVARRFPFDEVMEACEDKEWANRVVSAGHRLVYSPDHAVSGLHRRREGLRALYRRARRESGALTGLAGHPVWSLRLALAFAVRVARSRRGLKRLAPLRASNVVESVGRVVGARAQQHGPPPRPSPAAEVLVKQVAPLLADRVDLVNFPLHNNCGDSAIWMGQRAMLRTVGVPESQVRTFTNTLGQFGVRRPAPTVLVRGGGYFGDLWTEEFQAFLDACESYRGSRLVFMPQTVGALSERTIDATSRAIARHGRVTLLLRDQRSVATVQRLFPGVDARLSPDAAQCLTRDDLWRLRPRRVERRAVRVIARRDAEADSSLATAASERGIPVFDFVDAPSRPVNRAFRELHEVVRARLPRPIAAGLIAGALPRARLLDLHASGEVRRAMALIVGADRIVTDRLHAAILASILEVEVTAVDTGYGKLTGYFDAWPSPHVSFAPDAAAALQDLT